MKIGVISDTHSIPIPKKVLDELAKVDLIIHAGDICDLDTLKFLSRIQETKAVQGNMCDSSVKKKLPLKEIIEVESVRIGLTHGHIGMTRDALTNAKQAFKDQKVDIIIFGHSHQAFNKIIDGVLYFNPGSPNDVVKAPFFSWGLIEIKQGRIKADIIKL